MKDKDYMQFFFYFTTIGDTQIFLLAFTNLKNSWIRGQNN